jgi:hypothetical protein
MVNHNLYFKCSKEYSNLNNVEYKGVSRVDKLPIYKIILQNELIIKAVNNEDFSLLKLILRGMKINKLMKNNNKLNIDNEFLYFYLENYETFTIIKPFQDNNIHSYLLKSK